MRDIISLNMLKNTVTEEVSIDLFNKITYLCTKIQLSWRVMLSSVVQKVTHRRHCPKICIFDIYLYLCIRKPFKCNTMDKYLNRKEENRIVSSHDYSMECFFCQFKSLEYGWRAAFYLLTRTYYHKYRLYTIRTIIRRWAPVE